MLREVELQESAADDATLLSRGTRDPRGDDSNLGSTTFLGRVLGALAAEPLLFKTVLGVVLGILVGTISRAASPTPRAVELIGFPGKE